MNIAVILAGGKGIRFGSEKPKQFAKLAGKPIIEYTFEKFYLHKSINEIIIVSNENYIDKIRKIVKKFKNKPINIIKGGENRNESTLNAIRYLDSKMINETDNILIHDAVRPFVSKRIIDDCIKALNQYKVVDVAIDSTDTLIRVKENKIIEIPHRSEYKRGQTPQAFKFKVLKESYKNIKKEFTCDCSVAFDKGYEVYLVKGEESNIKITYPIDIFLAEKFIQMGINTNRTNNNFSKLKGKNILIFGNSSGIGKEIEIQAKKYEANVYGSSRSNGVDITNMQTVRKFLNEINVKFDIVYVTAGELIKKTFDELSYEEILSQIQINYIGTINIAKSIKPYLNKKANVIFFSSSSYTRGRAECSIYSSSKAAIVNFTQALAQEWEKDVIKVNCISPQRTFTPMRVKNFKDDSLEELLNPKEVALKSLQVGLSDFSGLILDLKKDINL